LKNKNGIKTNVELTAPAGSWESLLAGIQAGTDSVYFGVQNLNMRSRSSNNFSLEDLPKIIRICEENSIKSYLTVNTIVYDKEFDKLKNIINEAKNNNVSAIIASDQGVINYANSIGVKVHISTQLKRF